MDSQYFAALVLLISAISTITTTAHNSTGVYQTNSYNRVLEVCCHGQVYSSATYFETLQCCGTGQILPSEEICCVDTSYRIKQNHVCCGNKYHSPKESLCCHHPYSGKPFVAQMVVGSEEFTQCCGIRAYDTRIQICCNLEVSEFGPIRPHSDPFAEVVTRFIIHERAYQNSACCNGRVFDADVQNCTDDDPAVGALYTRSKVNKTIGVCGHLPYNIQTHWCCSGRIDLNDENSYDFFISKEPCCKLKSYDPETHACCVGSLHAQNFFGSLVCCGYGGIYDARIQRCCGYSYNVIPYRQIEGRGDMCCGEQNIPYNSPTQACCGNSVLNIPAVGIAKYQCCINPNDVSQVELFLKDKEICCNGVKHFLEPRSTHCCGQKAYSPKTELCCDEKLFIKLTPFDGCCGGKMYNGKAEVCCGLEDWTKMKRERKKRECCIKHFEQNETTDCECDVKEPQIYPKLRHIVACCGSELYNTATHHCCDSIAINKRSHMCCVTRHLKTWDPQEHVVEKSAPNAQCCGTKSYNPNSELCCSDGYKGLVTWIGLDDLGCCYTQVYDKQSQICCNETVYDLWADSQIKCCGNRIYFPSEEICCELTEDVFPVDVAETSCCYG